MDRRRCPSSSAEASCLRFSGLPRRAIFAESFSRRRRNALTYTPRCVNAQSGGPYTFDKRTFASFREGTRLGPMGIRSSIFHPSFSVGTNPSTEATDLSFSILLQDSREAEWKNVEVGEEKWLHLPVGYVRNVPLAKRMKVSRNSLGSKRRAATWGAVVSREIIRSPGTRTCRARRTCSFSSWSR